MGYKESNHLFFGQTVIHDTFTLDHTSVEEKNTLNDVLKVRAIRSGNACDWMTFKMSQRCKQ